MSLSSKERQWLEKLVLDELKLGHKLKDIVERTDEGFSNELYEVSTDWGGVFVKLNRELNLFEGEAASLRALGAVSGEHLRVPQVKALGTLPALFNGAPGSYLILEHVYMREIASHPKDQALLGAAVARLHSADVPEPRRFGFAAATYLGGMRLDNEWSSDWWTFFAQRRLAPLFLAAGARHRDRALSALWRRLQLAIPRLFAGPDAPLIVPSLLHGDLSPLNASSTELKLGKWQPCLFDPAAQYGHAEFDLALSQLPIMEQYRFHAAFYEEYFKARPKQPGFELREKIYVLYHALNHHNIYGTAYGDFKGHVLRLGEELLATIDPIADPGPQPGDPELEWDRIEEELARKARAAEARHVPEFQEAFKTVDDDKPKRKQYDDSDDDSSDGKPETALPKFVAAPAAPRPLELDLNRAANVDSDTESSSDAAPRTAKSPPPAAKSPPPAAAAAEANAFASIFAAVDDGSGSGSDSDGGAAPKALLSPRGAAAAAAAAAESHKSPRSSGKDKSLKKSGGKHSGKSVETKTERKAIKTDIDVDAELSPRKSRKSSGDVLSPRSKEKRHHKSSSKDK